MYLQVSRWYVFIGINFSIMMWWEHLDLGAGSAWNCVAHKSNEFILPRWTQCTSSVRRDTPRHLDAARVAAVSVVVSYLVALSMNSLSTGLDSKVITVMEFSKSN